MIRNSRTQCNCGNSKYGFLNGIIPIFTYVVPWDATHFALGNSSFNGDWDSSWTFQDDTAKKKISVAGKGVGETHNIQTALMSAECDGQQIEKSIQWTRLIKNFKTAKVFRFCFTKNTRLGIKKSRRDICENAKLFATLKNKKNSFLNPAIKGEFSAELIKILKQDRVIWKSIWLGCIKEFWKVHIVSIFMIGLRLIDEVGAILIKIVTVILRLICRRRLVYADNGFNWGKVIKKKNNFKCVDISLIDKKAVNLFKYLYAIYNLRLRKWCSSQNVSTCKWFRIQYNAHRNLNEIYTKYLDWVADYGLKILQWAENFICGRNWRIQKLVKWF